jgi:methionyl-tRNA synthetase
MQQSYCEKCSIFLADRYVRGTCPGCGFTDAYGDQCDKCNKILNSHELIDASCQVCKSKTIIKETKHCFLDLPKLQPQLESWIEKQFQEGEWT